MLCQPKTPYFDCLLPFTMIPWNHDIFWDNYPTCHESGCHSPHLSHHTTAAHHPWTASPIIHCTHTFPSTITPITQLSPITHLSWLSHHTCTSFTHTHLSSTLPCKHCKVLFCPGWHSERFPCILFPCVYLDCLYTLTVCCLPFDPACLSISSLSAACPDLCIAPVADSALPTWHLLLPLTLACLTLPCCSLKLHLDLNATDSSRYTTVKISYVTTLLAS